MIVLRHLTRPFSLCMALIALNMLPVAVNAQTTWYAVELIIFENLDEQSRFAESWREDPGLPDISRASPVSTNSGVSPVSPSAYRLSGAWQAMRNSSRYQPLQHLAWTQLGTSARSAPEVLIGEDPQANLFGTLRITRSRFLHLDVDLLFRDDDGVYRFQSHRRMRSNELHYLDHPRFGVLIIVTPLKN
jgi:hypothetical protein